MTIERTISDITSMPLHDQIVVLQTVWDQMPSEAGTQLTSEQRVEFERRLERYRKNPESALTESQLRTKIQESRKK